MSRASTRHCQLIPTQIRLGLRVTDNLETPSRPSSAASLTAAACPLALRRTRSHSRTLRGLSARNSHLTLVLQPSHDMCYSRVRYTVYVAVPEQSICPQCSHSVPRSKSLPFCLPAAYVLALGTNGRGGGKPDTMNVCDPTFGGGVGTRKRRNVRLDAQGHSDVNARTLSTLGRGAVQLRGQIRSHT